MDTKTRTILADLNRVFYTRFAGDFARTRRAWPPGFDIILPYLQPVSNILDLGCGNARLLSFLSERGWRGTYIGVDASEQLLAIAAENSRQAAAVAAHFVLADLLEEHWPTRVRGVWPAMSGVDARAGAIAALAVLHHIPGANARARFLAECARLLPQGGHLILSTWQFMMAPRLRERILSWETVGLSPQDVEPGDHLLSWGDGAAGLRYCAAIDRDELAALAAQAGLALVDTFTADGLEGNLNLYGILQRQEP